MLNKIQLTPFLGAGTLLYLRVGFSELRNEQKRPAPIWVSLYPTVLIEQCCSNKNRYKLIIKAPD